MFYDSMMNLKFPPIKPQKLPERVIYKSGENYIMFSTKTGEKLGHMIAGERFFGKAAEEDYIFYPKKENYIHLYIIGLWAKFKKQGIGKQFIELAKNLANNERCQNRVTVYAMNNQDGNILKASSPFFRKCGFTSSEKPGLEDVDRVLKGLKQKHGDWYCSLPMYLPVNQKK